MKNVYVKSLKKIISLVLLIQMVFSPGLSLAQVMPNSSQPENLVQLTPTYNPIIINGLKIYPDNPLRFDFIVDRGDTQLSADKYQRETEHLIRYFMASLAVPEKDMWVNLSPYEKNRILPDNFGKTQMGVDLLAQDYLLKQITASLMYPEGEIGKKFWAKVNEQARQKFNISEIPIETFNKVWIVPDVAEIYVNNNVAFIVKSRMKVMLEKDYLSIQNSRLEKPAEAVKKDSSEMSQMAAQVVKEIVIPALEKEVNEGEHFSLLRQIYNSMILATWYKYNVKNSVVNQMFSNQGKVGTTKVKDPAAKDQIYQNYVQSFKKGIYNYIVEENDPVSGETVPRKYFSGGVALNQAQIAAASGVYATLRLDMKPLIRALKDPQRYNTVQTELGVTNINPQDLSAAAAYIYAHHTSADFRQKYPGTTAILDSLPQLERRRTITRLLALAGVTAGFGVLTAGGIKLEQNRSVARQELARKQAPFIPQLETVLRQVIESPEVAGLKDYKKPVKIYDSYGNDRETVIVEMRKPNKKERFWISVERSPHGDALSDDALNKLPLRGYSFIIHTDGFGLVGTEGIILFSTDKDGRIDTQKFVRDEYEDQAKRILSELIKLGGLAEQIASPLLSLVLVSSTPIMVEMKNAVVEFNASADVDAYLQGNKTIGQAETAFLDRQKAASSVTGAKLRALLITALVPFLLSANPVMADTQNIQSMALSAAKAEPTDFERKLSSIIADKEKAGAFAKNRNITIFANGKIEIFISKYIDYDGSFYYSITMSERVKHDQAIVGMLHNGIMSWADQSSWAGALKYLDTAIVETADAPNAWLIRGIRDDLASLVSRLPAQATGAVREQTDFEKQISAIASSKENAGDFATDRNITIFANGKIEIFISKYIDYDGSFYYSITMSERVKHDQAIVGMLHNGIMSWADQSSWAGALKYLDTAIAETADAPNAWLIRGIRDDLAPLVSRLPAPATGAVREQTDFEKQISAIASFKENAGDFTTNRNITIFANGKIEIFISKYIDFDGSFYYSITMQEFSKTDLAIIGFLHKGVISWANQSNWADALKYLDAAIAETTDAPNAWLIRGIRDDLASLLSQTKPDKVGGIDLDPGKAKFVIGGKTVEMIAPQNPIYYENLFNNEIVPNVMQIQTIPNLPAILGLNQADQNQPVKSAEAQTPADQISMMPGKEQEQQYN